MSEFIKTLLSLSFSGTLLLLFLLLLKPLYKNKFSKCWQYYIWLIIALRFLLPIPSEHHIITITDYLIEKADTIKNKNDIIKIEQNKVNKKKKDSEIESNTVITKNTTAQVEKLNVDNHKKYISTIMNFFSTIPLYFCFFLLWLIIAFVLFLQKVLRYQNFVHYIEANNIEVSEIEILNVLADCEEIAKISKPIKLYHNPFLASPIMIGFFHPKIILSTQHYNKDEMFYIFLHELIHYKRLDIIYKWFIQIIICIHWFNPFIYLWEKEINKACELSCDEAVLSFLEDKEKIEYGDMLIAALKIESTYKSPYTFITFAENTKQIKERLGAIMNFKKKSNLIKIITAIFTISICFCFSAIGVYASNDNIVSENAKTTKKDKTEKTQVYTQQVFFHNSYLIEMGWNINKKDKKSIADKAIITLEDTSNITIYFYKETKEYKKDKKVLTAIKEIIDELKNSDLEYPIIKEPYIRRIDYIQSNQISAFVKKSFDEDDIIGFSGVFSELDKNLQKKYYKKAYNKNEIAFFTCVIKNMDRNTKLSYIKKAIEDEDVAYFSILLDQLSLKDSKQLVKKYINQFYKTDNFPFFSISLNYLSKQEKKKWLTKAEKDGERAFYFIISDEI